MTEEPPSVAGFEQGRRLDKIAKDANRVLAFTSLAVSSCLLLVIILGSWYGYHLYTSLQSTNNSINNAKKSTCDFYAVIGTIPTVQSGPDKSSKTLVRLIGDARITYYKRGCGSLPSPSAALLNLSAQYGIAVSP